MTRGIHLFTIFVVLATGIGGGCRRAQRKADVANTSRPAADAVLPHLLTVDSPVHATGCPDQAIRMMRAGWFRSVHDPRVDVVRFQDHYSPKYDQCYVLVDTSVSVANEGAAVVSELWDAFDATALALCTDDERTVLRRRFCQVTIGADPFTSCGVCRFFIREHMAH